MELATLALLALVVLLLNADVLYFLRLFVVVFKGFVCKQQKDILKEHEIPGIVLFGDLDSMLHMNNARYLRECDFARIALCFSHGIAKAMRACRATIIAGGLAIRYRRSLTLFERFIIRTKILCWDSKAFYMEQQFVARRDGRTAAIALVKMNVRGATPDDVVRNLCRRSVESPTPPLEVQCWMEYDDASRQALSDEGQ